MRKVNFVVAISVMLALFAGLAIHQVSAVSAQGESPLGVVVAYLPGVSITIIDVHGIQTEFALDSSLKIEPADKADSLKVGSFVTIIAPANVDKTKKTAVGIVVHPKTPDGLKELLPTATPLVKNTPMPPEPTLTATPKASETPTPFESASPTPFETLTETATPGPIPKQEGTNASANAFIEWLRALFVQVLSRQ